MRAEPIPTVQAGGPAPAIVQGRATLAARLWHYGRVLVENLAPLLVLLLLWEAVARSGAIHPGLFPSVTTIFETMWDLTREGVFVRDTAASLIRVLASGAVAMVFGTAVGLLMGTRRWIERAFVPPLTVFLSIPGIAVFPIAILWFGLSETTIIVTLGFEASITVTVNTWTGVKGVSPSLLNAGQAMGARGVRLFWRVLIPAALPSIITGYRQALSRAWRILVAGEMLASIGVGLGFRIFEARNFLAADVMYAGVFLIGLFGFLLERVVLRSLELYTVQRWGMLREL